MTRQLALAAASLLALAGCTAEMEDDKFVSNAPAARIVGAPENCIYRPSVRDTEVQDNRTIDFEMAGGRIYRNTLPNRCPGLAAADAFTYATSLSQLCSTEIIYPLLNYGGTLERGAGCGLGQFVPVDYIGDDDR